MIGRALSIASTHGGRLLFFRAGEGGKAKSVRSRAQWIRIPAVWMPHLKQEGDASCCCAPRWGNFLIWLGKRSPSSFSYPSRSLGYPSGYGLFGVTYESGQNNSAGQRQQIGSCRAVAWVLFRNGTSTPSIGEVSLDIISS